MLPDWLKKLAAECPDQDRRQLEKTLDKTQVERTRRWRENQRKRGTKPVTVQCPVDRVDELKALVAQWRAGK